MTSRFKRQQKIQKWNESLVWIPEEISGKIENLRQGCPGVAELCGRYLRSSSVFQRTEILEKIVSTIGDDDEDREVCGDILQDMLFVEPAKEMHQHILSCLKKFPSIQSALPSDSGNNLLENQSCVPLTDHLLVVRIRKSIELSRTPIYKEHELPLVVLFVTLISTASVKDALRQEILSMLEIFEKTGCFRETCCETCICFCRRMRSVFSHAVKTSSSPLPWQLEEAQEAVSVIYALMSQFLDALLKSDHRPMAIEMLKCVAETMFWLLQNEMLTHEAMPSAGVTLWVAICQPMVTPVEALELIAEGYNVKPPSVEATQSASSRLQASFVEEYMSCTGTSLCQEFRAMNPFGRICSLRGIVSILTQDVLLQRIDGGPLVMSLLIKTSEELSGTIDVSLCFHLLCALNQILDRFKEILLTPKESTTTEDISIQESPAADFYMTWDLYEQVLHSVWRHLEDSVHQTERQAVNVFNALMDILDAQHKMTDYCETQDKAESSLLSRERVCKHILQRLMLLTVHKKGKYTLLSSVVPRLGASEIMMHAPNLIESMMRAFSEPIVCKQAANFLICFLKQLKSELPLEWVQQPWMSALMTTLLFGNPVQRANLLTYLLPPLVQMQKKIFDHIMSGVLHNKGDNDAALSVVISLLRIVRQERLIPDLKSVMDAGDDAVSVPKSYLMEAVFSESESLYLSVVELACVRPKPSVFPEDIDYEIVKQAFVVALRSANQAMRNKWQLWMEKFMIQLRVAVHAFQTKQRHAHAVNKARVDPRGLDGFRTGQEFMQWLAQTVLYGLYPGATSAKKIMCLETLCTMLKVWNPFLSEKQDQPVFVPFSDTLLGSDTVETVLGCFRDSWDRIRNAAMSCLLLFPTPLPGMQNSEALLPLLKWIWDCIDSPRLRDNDCGVQILRVIHEKYAMCLGWSISLFPEVTVQQMSAADSVPQMALLRSLLYGFESNIRRGEEDLLVQCHRGLAHGVLLAMSHLIEATDWTSIMDKDVSLLLKEYLIQLLAVIPSCSHLCLSILQNQDVNIDAEEAMDDQEMKEEEDMSLGPDAQLLVTGTWLTIKELSLLLATIAQHFPIKDGGHKKDAFELELDHIRAMGVYFLETLIKLKHNGAVDKTATAFQAVSEQLLHGRLQEYRRLPAEWLESLLDRVKAPNQCRDDIIRRSAGLPFGIAALLRSEPQESPKTLLPHGVQSLIQIIQQPAQHGPWTRIHAFHVLRHVFNDKLLASNASEFMAEVLKLCLDTMADSVWEVRNAASLCFATVMTRMVGYKNKIGSGTRQKSISAFEFFFRYPSLLEDMAKELTEAARAFQSSPSALPVTLGPILVLLTRLLPSTAPPLKTSASQQPAILLPAIQGCLSASHMAVRQMAARAAVPLIVKGAVGTYVQQIVEQLPKNVQNSRNNTIHGQLLAVRALLEAQEGDLDGQLDESTLLRIIQSSWMLNADSISFAVRTELLSLICDLDSHDPAFSEKTPCLVHLATNALKERNMYLDAMQPVFLQTCTRFLFQKTGFELSEQLLDLTLEHPCYDVRLEALRQLHSRIQDTWRTADFKMLKERLQRRLNLEIQMKCLRKCLKLLAVIYELNQQDELDSLSLWKTLSKLHVESGQMKIKQYSLLCLGHILHAFLTNASGSATDRQPSVVLQQVLVTFQSFILNCSDCSSPLSLRQVSIDALRHSGLCQIEADIEGLDVSSCSLPFWMILSIMTEDEAAAIRRSCTSLISLCLKHHLGSCVQRLPSITAGKELLQLMSQKFHGQLPFLQFLLDIVFNSGIDDLPTSSMSGRARRLFDKDMDNRHVEVLYQSQMAALHAMHQLNQLKNADAIDCWLKSLVKRMQGEIQRLKAVQTMLHWKGQFTQHDATFVFLYRGLLAIWILAKSDVDLPDIRSTIPAVISEVQALPLHDYLLKMTKLIQRGGHEADIDPINDFNPMFLLSD